MTTQSLQVVVLAAGQGKRMHSRLPKVLHPLAGRPMLLHVLDSARRLAPSRLVVVIGHGGEAVASHLEAPDVAWALQDRQLGTGHAVRQASDAIAAATGPVMVLCADTPLLTAATLRALLAARRPLYAQADLVLTQQEESPDQVARKVLALLPGILRERPAPPGQTGAIAEGAAPRRGPVNGGSGG